LLLIDSRTARVLVTALLFALGLSFLYVTRQTLIAFLFAIFFAYLVSPLVNTLERVLKGRGRAIAVIYALLLGLLVLFFALVGPKVMREGARLGQSLKNWARSMNGTTPVSSSCVLLWPNTATRLRKWRSGWDCAWRMWQSKRGYFW